MNGPQVNGRRPKAHIVTLGCQMNVRDSQTLAGMLQRMGYGFADRVEDADLVLFNTCSVRENPERKIYGQVAALQALKQRRPGMLIGICGCMPQQRPELERMRKELPHVDLILGTFNLHRFPDLLQQVVETGRPVVEVWHDEGEIVEGLPVLREPGSVTAFVSIIYGCDYRCTFCVVPNTRGRQRSRRPEAIEQEVRELVAQGVREVTLLGQTANAYGRDLPQEHLSLARLLERLSAIDGLERIRFTSNHPREMTEDLIEAMARLPKVAEHVHLAVQSGSDRMLHRMGRRYTADEFVALVERMRQAIPELSVTTDIIVGFPGETDADFRATLDLVRTVRFDGAFTFVYSPRPGTAALKLPDPVPEPVKRERIQELIAVQNAISLERNLAYRDRTVEVLVEGQSERSAQRLSGRTRTNKVVVFDAPAEERHALIGRLVPIVIEDVNTWTLFGRLAASQDPASLVAGAGGQAR
ncbi:tRNA (N6-isopentenyl adenosine(37)-C2)-methylthiotransferase MiaB [Carboxydochorda subterranea]|uniref:tRNA-2-methylthio-N(6)-dimethylallyladenosine synthase n=1 Tax=Carboxydichorda subterranea TaxID=3109565 RepID=A0ABZ1C087_9FIRM|nr:tRNA (N6-isopentenyl adenosine(37)-C2)-methylthiotransferase MiaB [Limnochorda sp. L945t]WRP18504.1 tRNA (N6-isopentenyl adenosine(37)-C2)-methylthiotransferase MiaB [Limnochorda sp. L945t]